MADELERPEESSETHEHDDPGAHLPPPTIWPFAFAGAVALILVGLIVSTWASVIGIVLAVVFGFLWIREVTREVRAAPEPASRSSHRRPSGGGGRGGRAGALSALEVPRGRHARPRRGHRRDRDAARARLRRRARVRRPGVRPTSTSGRSTTTPRASGSITTFTADSGGRARSRGAPPTSATTASRTSVPSFTILSNRCVHLGCPTQPQGPPGEPKAGRDRRRPRSSSRRREPSGFGCPCHGGAYDIEGNRTPGRPCARSTATSTRSSTATSGSASSTPSPRSRARAPTR